MKRALFTLVSLVAVAAAWGQKTYVLEGTIGTIPVFMKLDDYPSDQSPDDPNIEGRYFYKTSLKDISMHGRKQGEIFTLLVNDGADKPDETWELKHIAGNRFTGTWKNKKGEVLPVSLMPADVNKVSNLHESIKYVHDLKAEQPYDYIRSSFIKLKRDGTSTYKGKSFVWISEEHCDMSLFRLGNGFSKKVLDMINPQLDDIQFEEIINQLSCTSPWEYNKGKSIDYTTNITYLNENLLGFNVFASWYCGGAHPDFGSTGYLIDLNNGKQYELDDILAFDKSVTTEKQSNFDKFSAYRTNYVAPQLLSLMNAAHHFKKPQTEEDCDYLDENIWRFPQWKIKEEGMSFMPVFGRVNRNCEEDFFLSFDKLKKYKNPSFPYQFK